MNYYSILQYISMVITLESIYITHLALNIKIKKRVIVEHVTVLLIEKNIWVYDRFYVPLRFYRTKKTEYK